MKFTEGHWFLRPGISPLYPMEAHDVVSDGRTLTVSAPGRKIEKRGDTLNVGMLTFRYSSPLQDVIRVECVHHAGEAKRGPQFAMEPLAEPQVAVSENDETASLTSGRLTVRVAKRSDWTVDFLAEGRRLTGSGPKSPAWIETGDAGCHMREQLDLGVGECVYGLGERFTAFVRNGQVVDMWNLDGGTASELAYKNIPFYLTNRGYGVFVNDPGPVSFEVATERVFRTQFSVPGQRLEYLVIYGPTPKEIIEKYTALTGRPALPPAWSFGLWLTTSFTTSYDEATVTGFIQGMADRRLPLHVFHFDCFWMREFQWCDFEWDPRVFPNPREMLRRLHERGLHVCAWINSYIGQRSHLFAEAAARGYLLRRPNGDVWQTDAWQAGMGIVDFTHPDAREWYASKLRALIDMGVDCFKTDFGERIPTDVVHHDGSDPVRMHNYHTFLYNQTVFETLRAHRGDGEAVVFARSATAGGQRFPAHWGGDSFGTYESMAETLRGGLSLGLAGFGFWSHDIGGFEATAPAHVYKRWVAFGLLSSHSRLHGNSSYRVPWLYDEEAVDVLRFFTNLKCRLMPYLYEKAREASATGVPILRAMMLEFPRDPACDYLDRQYMLGEALLVAPVFEESGAVRYFVPEGRWTHFLTGEVVTGPAWVAETHGFLSLPLLARPHSAVAVGAVDTQPDYDYAAGVTIHVFELSEGRPLAVSIPDIQSKTALRLTLSRTAGALEATAEPARDGWSLLLRGEPHPPKLADAKHLPKVEGETRLPKVERGTVRLDPLGILVTPDAGAKSIRLSWAD